jgi:hypothetical protein
MFIWVTRLKTMLFLLFNTPEKMAEVTILKCMDLLLHSYLEEIDSKSVPLTSKTKHTSKGIQYHQHE